MFIKRYLNLILKIPLPSPEQTNLNKKINLKSHSAIIQNHFSHQPERTTYSYFRTAPIKLIFKWHSRKIDKLRKFLVPSPANFSNPIADISSNITDPREPRHHVTFYSSSSLSSRSASSSLVRAKHRKVSRARKLCIRRCCSSMAAAAAAFRTTPRALVRLAEARSICFAGYAREREKRGSFCCCCCCCASVLSSDEFWTSRKLPETWPLSLLN